jgi:hypothetical protein
MQGGSLLLGPERIRRHDTHLPTKSIHPQQFVSCRRITPRKHAVDSTYLSATEIASVIRYLNYASHFEQPELSA